MYSGGLVAQTAISQPQILNISDDLVNYRPVANVLCERSCAKPF